jgi:hypothetical protein
VTEPVPPIGVQISAGEMKVRDDAGKARRSAVRAEIMARLHLLEVG